MNKSTGESVQLESDESRLTLAKRNTVEIMTEKELEDLITKKKSFEFYIGLAPTGAFHIGYLVPVMKVIDLIKLGGKATVLIADYHAYLDDKKTTWNEMELKGEYYETILRLILKEYEEDISFVRGSSYQTSKEYVEDVFKLSALVSTNRARRAASEVVRMTKAPSVSSLLYPIMQNVDVKHLKAHVVVGGLDQRSIYALGREIIENIGYQKFVSIFTPLITSLKGSEVKMSASMPDTRITAHEELSELRRKINKAFCPAGALEGNPIIDIIQFIIFPFFGKLVVNRKGKYNDTLEYDSFDDIGRDYKDERIHPLDLKDAVSESIAKLLKPIRQHMKDNPGFASIIEAIV